MCIRDRIWRVWNGAYVGQLTPPYFVEYLSGFFIAPGIDDLPLELGKDVCGCRGWVRVQHHDLKTGNNRVTPEWSHEPRHACAEEVPHLGIGFEHADIALAAS